MLLACNSVEKHRSTIETLAANWAETTNQVTDFSEKMNSSIIGMNQQISQLGIPQEEIDALPADKKSLWEGMRTKMMDAIGGFGPIQQGLSSFMKTWSENSESLNGIVTSLNAGDLKPEAISKVSDLQTMLGSAKEKIGEWTKSFDAQKATAQSTLDAMKEARKAVMGE